MAEDKNDKVKEAVVEYEYLTGEEDVQRIAFLKRKYELDYNSGMYYAKQRGIEEGVKKGKIEIALKMLDMQIDKETISKVTISKVTGLNIDEIEKLKK